jgi:hypothetical protein
MLQKLLNVMEIPNYWRILLWVPGGDGRHKVSGTFGWSGASHPARLRTRILAGHQCRAESARGAHIDSPLHVFKDGITTAEMRLEQGMVLGAAPFRQRSYTSQGSRCQS